MFDIGFMELLLIGIVALLVLGPDKLPGAIRTGALWFGRAKRSFNNVKAEIEQQINTDEIRRQLHNESILGDIDKAKKNADKLIKDTQAEIKNTEDSVKRSINADSKNKTASKATSSADEGVPTPPPEGYRVPDKANPAPKDAVATESESEPEVAAEPAPEPDQEQSQTSEDSGDKPSQDIYSTPPSGIVSMHNGKFSAADDKKPKNPDSSSSEK
jgi:sec-independent protein translocase protein TatB